jgi:Alpha/beta hydrolase domain
MLTFLARVVLFVTLVASPVAAEIVRIEVHSRSDLLGGQPFGSAGPYEKLAGKMFFAIDPSRDANRIVTDLDKAPRSTAGKVEFSSDFFLIKPKQVERGNGAVLYEVSNRGGKGMLGFFNHASGSLDPTSAAEFGDGFLLRQGFTLLWVGWQFDPPQRPGLVRVYPPTASDNGRPIRGRVRSDFVVAERALDHSLADRDHLAYPVLNASATDNVMTVRDSVEGPRRVVPRAQWKFARVEEGRIIEDKTRVYMPTGFEPGKIYEVLYTADNPPIVGLGPAAIRDAISLLKYGSGDALSIPSGAVKRALAFGVSQSGRFLRTYLYYGFNRDEGNRKVFDGVIAHVAGAGRGSFNHRFAQPSRDGHPYLNFFYPTDIFPFTDIAQTDPETGLTDGLLTHARGPEFLPRIFYTTSEYEYWGRAASLIHTTIDGSADAAIMDNVRIYLLAAGQHGPGPFPPVQTIGRQRNNPLDFRWGMKALLVAMDNWVANGKTPPPSRYPTIEDGTLVTPDRLRFPKVPGVTTSTSVHRAYRVDYGPRFVPEGIVTEEPPKVGKPFPILVPQVDADGNGVAGVRMPELSVPLATYTGWNLFNARSGPTDVLSSMQGSYIPLLRTRVERERTNDPRPSIEERYRDKDHYLTLVTKAAQELVDQGLVLEEDVSVIVGNAGRHWDHLSSATTTASGVR